MGYAETGTNEPNTSLGYRGYSSGMNFNIADIARLANVPLSKRDLILLAVAIAFFGVVLGALTSALIYISFLKTDPQYIASVLVTAFLVSFGLVFIFVAGSVEQRRQTMRVLTPPLRPRPDQSEVNVNVGAPAAEPPPLATDVKEVKADTKAIRKKVKA